MKANEKAKLCAVFPALGEAERGLCRELEEKCAVEIDPRETRHQGKDAVDYAIQCDPDFSVSEEESNAVLRHINDGAFDGLILFPGYFDRRFYLTGRPMLIVDTLPSLQLGFKNAMALARQYERPFITATWNRSDTDVSESVSQARQDALRSKIKLFGALQSIKRTRIMDVQVKGFGVEPHEHWWRLNQEEYLHALKNSLGTEVRIVDYRDLFRRYLQVDSLEAGDIAEVWLKRAQPTRAGRNTRNKGEATKEEVLKAALLYVAARDMMRESACNAVTMDATTWACAVGKSFAKSIGEKFLVSGSLGLTEFRLHGVPACCQSDMESLVTLIIGEAVTQRPGFHGDFVVDCFNRVGQIGHCNAPINPYGDERRAPYSIGGEPTRRPQVYVDLPEEGPVTVIKVNLLKKEISLWGGDLVPGGTIYKNFDESYCCTKLVVRTNAASILENYAYRTFGNHNCLFYGDFRNQIRTIAALLGFTVIEQDRQGISGFRDTQGDDRTLR